MGGRVFGVEFVPGGAGQRGVGAVWEDSGSTAGALSGSNCGDSASGAIAAGENARRSDGAAEGQCGAAGV